MASNFSIRNGFKNIECVNDCPRHIRTQLLHIFLDKCDMVPGSFGGLHRHDVVCQTLSRFGFTYEINDNVISERKNVDRLSKYITQECEWYVVYDFVEFYLTIFEDNEIAQKVNEILCREHAGYCVIDNMVVPLSNRLEMDEIRQTYVDAPLHVLESVNNAIKAYSRKPTPDYASAESNMITALEAAARTILDDEYDGSANSLTQAVNKLVENDFLPNDAFAEAMKKLYKYASDAGGIRHGKTEYTELEAADARFCIVTCSAMINLLIAKQQNIDYIEDEGSENV